MKPGRTSLLIVLAVAGALAALAAGLWVVAPYLPRSMSQSEAEWHPLDGIGGPFSLVNQRGETVTEARLKGKASLIFFGFTHCPEVCPTTLFEMSQRLKDLGPEADKLNVVFVSVDPERDTPEQVALYLQSFDPRIQGLTGSPEAVARIIKAYRVHARRVTLPDGSYTMDHTASLYGLDKAGRTRLLIDYQEEPAMALAKIRRLIGL